MLSIKPVFYVFAYVYLVNYLISILLQSSGEDHKLIVLRHQFNKLDTAWSNEEEALLPIFDVVDKGFVEIKHQSISCGNLATLEWLQEWWIHFW